MTGFGSESTGGRDVDLDDGQVVAWALLMKIFDHTYEEVRIDAARESQGADALTEVATSIAAQWDWDGPVVEYTERGLAALLGCIADPAIAWNVYSAVQGKPHPPLPAFALRRMAVWAGEVAPRKAWPAILWLLSNAYQMLGEIPAAEAALLKAESLEPQWGFIPEWQARYAMDRGDVEHGLALLRSAAVSREHPLFTLLLGLQAPERTDLGRNDKCWCGSERKYKSCHLRREMLPLEKRAYWLELKARFTLFENQTLYTQVLEIDSHISDRPGGQRDYDVHPLALDVVMYEGGGFAEFVRHRGYLLPDDELQLANRWLTVERAVYEVAFVEPGESLMLRSINTGEVTEVLADNLSPQISPGDLFCARIVPAGDTMQVLSPMVPVPPIQLEHLIAVLHGNPSPPALIQALKHRGR